MDGIWTCILYTKRLSAYRIHFFMLSVLILKALNLLCETEESDESVENLKALLEVETQVSIQQQQLLYNGKEMRNAEKLSGLGVNDGDLVMIVSHASSSRCA
ncbi:hypothetical protein ACSBR1_011594 [Camellia fascicularis]